MSIVVTIATPSDEPDWQAYVNSHPDATIYHTLEWRDILYNEYRFEPVYLMAKDGEKVAGILPLFIVKNLRGKRLSSLPLSIYGGPIGDNDAVVSALLLKCCTMVREGMASLLEIKPCKPIKAGVYGMKVNNCEVGTTVDLSAGIDTIWNRLTDRNDINRAVREGLEFSLPDDKGIEQFYKLQLITRKRLGLPTPSLRYYSSFFENMAGNVKLALVEKKEVAVAAGIFFVYKDTILYTLSASNHCYLHLKPNDLLIWEVMRWSVKAGYKKFDLGPTPSSYKGLIHFKAKWGGKAEHVLSYYYPDFRKKRVNSQGSLFYKMIPGKIARLIDSKLIKILN